MESTSKLTNKEKSAKWREIVDDFKEVYKFHLISKKFLERKISSLALFDQLAAQQQPEFEQNCGEMKVK